MNKWISKLFIFIIIVILLIAFFDSGESFSVDNLAIAIAMAIDKSDTNNLKVTFQFTNPSSFAQSGSSEKSETINYSINASSISSAMNWMNSYIGKELNLSHCKLIIFSEEVAKDDISDEIFTLINDPQIRPSANIIISKTSASFYLENAKPQLEHLITKYYESLTDSSEYTGYTSNATIGDFFDQMVCNSCEPYAILGGISSEKDDAENSTDSQKDSNAISNNSLLTEQSTSENIGLAVFKRGTLVGELNAIETLSFLATSNGIQGFMVSVPDPEKDDGFLDINMFPTSDSKIDVVSVSGSPYIKVSYRFKGRIASLSDNSRYLDPAILSAISNSCNKYLENVFSNYFYKTSKELGSDINRIGKCAQASFFTLDEFEDYNWNEKYKDAFFEVDVDTNITSSTLLTET